MYMSSTTGRRPIIAAPDRGAADGRLGDGRVEDAVAPERLEQALRGLERAPVVGHVLAVEDDPAVARHLLGEGLAERVAIEHALRGDLRLGRRAVA